MNRNFWCIESAAKGFLQADLWDLSFLAADIYILVSIKIFFIIYLYTKSNINIICVITAFEHAN